MKASVAFDSGATSDGYGPTYLDLVGIRAPQMASGTAYLLIETTEDDESVADADATWDTVYDQDGSRVVLAVSDSGARRVTFEPNGALLLRRWRFRAVNSSYSDVSQGTQEITMFLRAFGA